MYRKLVDRNSFGIFLNPSSKRQYFSLYIYLKTIKSVLYILYFYYGIQNNKDHFRNFLNTKSY